MKAGSLLVSSNDIFWDMYSKLEQNKYDKRRSWSPTSFKKYFCFFFTSVKDKTWKDKKKKKKDKSSLLNCLQNQVGIEMVTFRKTNFPFTNTPLK